MNLERLTMRRNTTTDIVRWCIFQKMIDYLWQRELRIPPPSEATKSADILIFTNVEKALEEKNAKPIG